LFELSCSLASNVVVEVNIYCFIVVKVLSRNAVTSLSNRYDTHHRPLQLLGQQLFAAFSHLLDDAASFSEHDSLLDLVFDVNMIVNSKFAVELGHPSFHFDSDLVGYLSKVALHYSLFKSFFGLLDFAFGRTLVGVVAPRSHFCLGNKVIGERGNSKASVARNVEDVVEGA
jgi:hypothetical protein